MEPKAVVLVLALAAGLVLLDRKAKSSPTTSSTWRPGGFLGPPVRGGGCGCHS